MGAVVKAVGKAVKAGWRKATVVTGDYCTYHPRTPAHWVQGKVKLCQLCVRELS